ncbi:MAG: hypothetical protein J1F38_06270 [Muribaculaceae bacterium]|nr:hypothetical protein [Muribaculaceae bacterium]
MRYICKFIAFLSIGLAFGLSSCINETPDPEKCIFKVTLTVHSSTEWLPDYEMNSGRASEIGVEYLFRIYNAGETSSPVIEEIFYSDDLTRQDFSIDFSLREGNYEIFVWSDFYDSSSGKSLYYNTENFSAISYLLPYQADSDNKDAFRGMTSLIIDDSMYGQSINAQVVLERPLAKYMLVATDLSDFLQTSSDDSDLRALESQGNFFENYSATISYPLFMPAVFNNFTNRPIDSWNDMSYQAQISPIGNGQALVGFDYVFINGEESSVQVALQISDAEGKGVSDSGGTINIPIKRNRTTIVYGKFLTTSSNGEITLDPTFKGQHNIEYN